MTPSCLAKLEIATQAFQDAGINVRIDVTDRCKVLKQDPCPAGQCFRVP